MAKCCAFEMRAVVVTVRVVEASRSDVNVAGKEGAIVGRCGSR